MTERTETQQLLCVISDLCDQVMDRDAEIERLKAAATKPAVQAAPDLLAAAKSMFDAARNNPLLMMALSSPLGLPAARALKAAIDKAEGTQSTGEKE
jgi:hypothetical protein